MGEQELLQCHTQHHTINGVSFASDKGNYAKWWFDDVQGENVMISN